MHLAMLTSNLSHWFWTERLIKKWIGRFIKNNHVAASISYHQVYQNNLWLANTMSYFLMPIVSLTSLKLTELITHTASVLLKFAWTFLCDVSVRQYTWNSVEHSQQRSTIPPGSSPLQRLPRWRQNGATRGSRSSASDDEFGSQAERRWLWEKKKKKKISVSSLRLWSIQTCLSWYRK